MSLKNSSVIFEESHSAARFFREAIRPAKITVAHHELGIYPGHTSLITRIRPGAVRIKVAGQAEDEFFFVAGGILEVEIAQLASIARLWQKR